MASQNRWTRDQLLIAFYLYCRTPFGKMHSRNPEIIRYANLIGRTPSAFSMKLTNIASLDPAIINSGRSGLSGASAADRTMWEEMSSDWNAFSAVTHCALQQLDLHGEVQQELEEEINREAVVSGEIGGFEGENRVVITTARVGQNLFRKSVLSAYANRCCISGLANPKFLIASHIVPWRDDPKNRLNPRNGLCLSVLHDRAFDQGLLAIDDNMRVVVSSKLKHEPGSFLEESVLAFEGKSIQLPEKFLPDKAFLNRHFNNVFISD